jgi:hypothetical protein
MKQLKLSWIEIRVKSKKERKKEKRKDKKGYYRRIKSASSVGSNEAIILYVGKCAL